MQLTVAPAPQRLLCDAGSFPRAFGFAEQQLVGLARVVEALTFPLEVAVEPQDQKAANIDGGLWQTAPALKGKILQGPTFTARVLHFQAMFKAKPPYSRLIIKAMLKRS